MQSRGPILVWGASGHAKVVADLARALGFDVLVFVDDDETRQDEQFFGGTITHARQIESLRRESSQLAIGVGDNRARERLSGRAAQLGFAMPPLVHPSAYVAPSATIGDGSVVMAHAVVNADARISLGVIVNTGCIIEHDCVVGSFSHVSPGATLAGAVSLGHRVHVGAGATVLPGVQIGDDAVVGAGAVAIDNVRPDSTVAGVPARCLESR